MARTVVGLFTSHIQATAAVRALKEAGFAVETLGFLTSETVATQAGQAAGRAHLVTDLDTPVEATLSHEGAAAGGILGASLGALLAATGAVAIPGIGPFIAGGILATAIAGGATGAIGGALVGLGVAREEAEYSEAQVHAGRTLVSATAPGRATDAVAILSEHGAEIVPSPRGATR